jgi:hypothetical protein
MTVEPTDAWRERLAAHDREILAIRTDVDAHVTTLEAKLAAAEAEARRLRAKVNALLELLAETQPPQ